MSPYDMPTKQSAGASRAPFVRRCTLAQCNAMLPLIRAIASELIERRQRFRALRSTRRELERSYSPEGLGVALADLETQILHEEDGILRVCEELTRHGLTVHRLSPLIVHFPGENGSDAAYCWREDEEAVAVHHPGGTRYGEHCCSVDLESVAAPLTAPRTLPEAAPLPAERSGPRGG